MTWTFTDEVEEYAAHAWDLLAAGPALNTVALTIIEDVRAGRRWSDEPMLFGWYESAAAVCGAVTMTPPFPLLLAEVPAPALHDLVEALLERAVDLPGVNAASATADDFATQWCARVPAKATTVLRSRLYRLDALRPPSPAPPGHARAAGEADADRAIDWYLKFHDEADPHLTTDVEPTVRDRLADARLWLWENGEGEVVSLAARSRTAATVARVGPVYTPPERRRRGYGAAVTAACTRDALERGADEVVLYTDLANPTSNAIYQQIGYVPLRDHQAIVFEST